jgi:hypothetical protein
VVFTHFVSLRDLFILDFEVIVIRECVLFVIALLVFFSLLGLEVCESVFEVAELHFVDVGVDGEDAVEELRQFLCVGSFKELWAFK